MRDLTLKNYFASNRKMLFGTFLLIILASVFAQLTPYIQGLFVDKAIVSQNAESLIYLCVVFLLVLILDAFSVFYLSCLANKSGYNASRQLRKYIFSIIVNKPYDFFKNKSNGDLLQRTNYFVQDIGNFLTNSVHNLGIGVARFAIIYIFMLVLNFKLGLVLGIIYFVAFVVCVLYSSKIFHIGVVLKKTELHRNSLVLENIENMETYLAYNDDFEYLPNYNRVNNKYDKVRNKYYWLYNSFLPIMDFIVSLTTVFIYQIAFQQVLGVFEIGVVIAMITYSTRMTEPIALIIDGVANLYATKAVWEKIDDLVDNENKIEKLDFCFKKINIECENVGYFNSLNGENFKNFNLEIPFKNKVLIYGHYGTGKSALANVIAGMFKAGEGNVYYNNMNIASIKRKSLMQMVSIIGDDVGIFNGTIYQNIRFGNPNATVKQIKKAIKQSGLEQYVNKMRNKEHTKISNSSVSESEKQLIAYARLILKNPQIVIIDEFTRDLEKDQESRFYRSLSRFCKDKTLIYCSEKMIDGINFDKKINFKKYNIKEVNND